jgi:serine/threonine-protein kinase
MEDLAGRTIGPYQLLDRIGTGGMATVYRALHRALGQPRAVKILLPNHAADPTIVERFKSEAKLAGGLRHPNIVSIYDVGEEDGLFYLVMDLVEGVPLRTLMQKGAALPPDRAVRMLRQLASALDYAHQRGIVHRDVKAGNVIVGPEDRVSLFDFGIARGLELGRLTKPGLMVGTPHYLAPEVISGDEGDRRADLYALGVLAYEMLTGRLPFGGSDTMTVLYAQVNKTPPPLRTRWPDLPEGVEAVMSRQLAKRPADRYPTAEAFVTALAEVARGATPASSNGTSVLGFDEVDEGEAEGTEATGQATASSASTETAAGSPRWTAPGLDRAPSDTPTPLPRRDLQDDLPTPPAIQRPAWRDGQYGQAPERPLPVPRPRRAQPGDDEWTAAAQEQLSLQRVAAQREIATRPERGTPLGLIVIGLLAVAVLVVGALALGQLGPVVGSSPTPTVSASTQPTDVAAAPTTVAVAADAPTAVTVISPLLSQVAPATAVPTPTPAPTAPPAPTDAPGQPTVAQAAPRSPEQQLADARAAVDAGDFQTAFSVLGGLQANAPGTEGLDDALYKAHLGYGQQLFEQGQPDASYAEFGEALKLRPDDPAALDGQKQIVLAKLWATMEATWDKDDAAASDALEQILALDPGYRDANVKLYALLVARADRLRDGGDTDGAIAALQRAREVCPEGEEARARLEALTAPIPEPTPVPAPARPQQPAPTRAPAPAPAPAPTSAPAPAQKPVIPSQLQPPANLPLPKPGGLPGLPLP